MDKRIVADELRGIVGSRWVADEPAVLEAYSRETLEANDGLDPEFDGRPDFVVMPETVDEIVQIVNLANRRRVPVVPIASYLSSYGDGIPLKGGILLDQQRRDKIEIDEETLTLVVEAGARYGKTWKACKDRRVMFPCFTGFPSAGSIVGPYSQRGTPELNRDRGVFGYLCEYITGLEIVLPTGRVLTTGSAALPGAGWHSRFHLGGPDLTGMFIGATGAYGIITKMGIRLEPIEQEGTVHRDSVWGGFEAFDRTVAAMLAIREAERPAISGDLTAHHWMKLPTLHADVGGMEAKPADQPLWGMNVSLAGKDSDVERAKAVSQRIIEEQGGRVLTSGPYLKFFFLAKQGPADGQEVRWRFGGRIGMNCRCPVGKSVVIEAALQERATACGFGEIGPSFHLPKRGAAHFAIVYQYRATDEEERRRAKRLEREIVEAVIDRGGIWYRNYAVTAKAQFPRLGTYYELCRELKAFLDPNDVMSPGRIEPTGTSTEGPKEEGSQ